MSQLKFHWFLPTNGGDGRQVVGGGHGVEAGAAGRPAGPAPTPCPPPTTCRPSPPLVGRNQWNFSDMAVLSNVGMSIKLLD